MGSIIGLCRHPLEQFSYRRFADSHQVWLLCHPEKSGVRSGGHGVPPERVRLFDRYDVDSSVEYEAARIIESGPCDAIVALSEVDVLRAAHLRTHYGLPGLGLETAVAFRDKVVMKRVLAAAGVAVPRFMPVSTGVDLRQAVEAFGYPLIVKPRSGGGSVGTRVVHDEAGLLEVLRAGLQPNFYTPANLEAEEFIDGEIFQVDGLVVDGRVYLQTVSRHRSDMLDFASPTWSRMVDQRSAQAERLRGFTERVLSELGLLSPGIHSYFHCEVFDTPRGPVLCEVASRPGGLGIVDQLDTYFGVDTFDLLLDATLGRDLPDPARLRPDGGLVGWVAVPAGYLPEYARSLVPAASRLRQRTYNRRDKSARRISSADFDGVMVVRGADEADLEHLLSTAARGLTEAVGVA
ncbi:acetyl-CoA carboxylase biotin carboxylase subunit family protein [Kitasatospora sp. NPDC093550]|uniref:ATP-grasp domain-containing protein n=1 Tax=Kitasatospora sp. NPDC093550 TaxID=3364089 RepID=UPI003817BA5E